MSSMNLSNSSSIPSISSSARNTAHRSAEQASFSQDLKDSIEMLIDGYARLLNATKFGSKYLGRNSSEREKLEQSVNAAIVVNQAQNLHRMISELKLSILTSNLEDQNTEVDAQDKIFNDQYDVAQNELDAIENGVDAVLCTLEAHYYSSVYR